MFYLVFVTKRQGGCLFNACVRGEPPNSAGLQNLAARN